MLTEIGRVEVGVGVGVEVTTGVMVGFDARIIEFELLLEAVEGCEGWFLLQYVFRLSQSVLVAWK